MTLYSRDFETPPEAAGFAPDPAGGFSPPGPGFDAGDGFWLALLVLALLGAGFAVGWFFAQRRAREDADRNAADIHASILKAAETALGAGTHDLVAKAALLLALINARLGPVIVVGAGLGGLVKALKLAVESRKPDDHGHSGGGHGGGGHGGSHGGGGHDAHGAGGHGDAGHAAPPGAVAVQQIVVTTAACGCAPATCTCVGHGKDHGKDHGGSHGEKHEDEHLTAPQQTEALSKAVRAFHDHWSQSGVRIEELRAARRALERPVGPTPAAPGGGKRIWDR